MTRWWVVNCTRSIHFLWADESLDKLDDTVLRGGATRPVTNVWSAGPGFDKFDDKGHIAQRVAAANSRRYLAERSTNLRRPNSPCVAWPDVQHA